jgi:hypothetical protein
VQESSESLNAVSFGFLCVRIRIAFALLVLRLTGGTQTSSSEDARFSTARPQKMKNSISAYFEKDINMKLFFLLASFVGLVGGQVVPDVTPMDYDHQGDALQGFLAMPEVAGDATPAVIIIP